MSAVEELTFVSSTGMLYTRPGSFQPLFSPLPVHDTLFFNEGPRAALTKTLTTSSLSGAINTSAIDAYAQGVEITNQSRYDAGIVKIWSGEPGHQLLKNRFGMDKNFFPDPGFADLDLFNPVSFLRAQEIESPLWWNIITFPIITGDSDQMENYYFDGIIEPLPIREHVAFFSTEVPYAARTVRGGLQSGNSDQLNGSDQVLTVDLFEPTQQIVGYLDMVDIIQNHPLNGFFRYEFTNLLPFRDANLIRNEPTVNSEPNDLIEALVNMSGSTDNYVRYDQRSAPCGWYYDNNTSVGTDSLSFGGMTY